MKKLSLTKQILEGHTIYRYYFNNLVFHYTEDLEGKVLDLAGGKEASYRKYLPKNIDITYSDIEGDTIIDFNQELPFEDNTFDSVFLFNAIYIAQDPVSLLKEIKRVLKPKGILYLSSPFISNVMPEPHDYRRYTEEGLRVIFKESQFEVKSIEKFGDRFTTCAYLLHPFMLFKPLRLIGYSAAILLDKIIPAKTKEKYPTPLGYFAVLEK